MASRLWRPLGMARCGFGGPGEGNARGHVGGVAQGAAFDNPPIIAPAGTAHCSLEAWAAFVGLHLRAARGESELLSAPSFAQREAGVDAKFGELDHNRDGLISAIELRDFLDRSRGSLASAGVSTFESPWPSGSALSNAAGFFAGAAAASPSGVTAVKGSPPAMATAISTAMLANTGFDKRALLHGRNAKPLPEEVDVVVIGAGLLGLMAAARLKKNGHKVAVLEQRSIVGGIWSMYANSTSQVNSSEGGYCLKEFLPESSPRKHAHNRDHSTAAEVLRDLEHEGAVADLGGRGWRHSDRPAA